MSAAPKITRADRIATLRKRYGFDKPCLPPRVVPYEETLYRALRPSDQEPDFRFERGRYVGLADLYRAKRRAFAARVWLARRLARMSIHGGLAAAWRGSAREDLLQFRHYHRAYLQARREGR